MLIKLYGIERLLPTYMLGQTVNILISWFWILKIGFSDIEINENKMYKQTFAGSPFINWNTDFHCIWNVFFIQLLVISVLFQIVILTGNLLNDYLDVSPTYILIKIQLLSLNDWQVTLFILNFTFSSTLASWAGKGP